MRFWKFLLPLIATSLSFAAQPDRIAGPIDSSQMIALKGNVHHMAQPQYDQGPVEDSLQFSYVTLNIPPSASQQAALDQLLAQQQDPKSQNYHKWLTPEQYAERFGLSQNDVNKITAWLTSQGLQVVRVARGRNWVAFSGTAAQIESAFRTQIHRYNIAGKAHVANSVSPSVPAGLGGVITGIRGLNDFRPRPMYVRPTYGKNLRRPGYTTTVEGNTEYFLAPGDVATLYDLNALYNSTPPIDGTGQKLAIIGQTDIYLADINYFRTGFGLSAITGCTTNGSGIVTACDATNFKYVVVGTDLGTPSTCGDVVEADLALEWSGATARNAQIVYVNAPATFNAGCTAITNGGGVFNALTYAIDQNVAPVISMSYGSCEAQSDLPAESLEGILQQANTQGMTVMTSSGDSGADTCDGGLPSVGPPYSTTNAESGLSVNYPASSPSVTAVGGTSIPTTEFTSTYWNSNNSSTTSFGASALPALIATEIAWNDDTSFATFCEGNSSQFCQNGDVSGGVPLTSAENVQEDFWISASGGGMSNCFTSTPAGSGTVCNGGIAEPTWQQSLTNLGLVGATTTYRLVPDVSLAASPNFPGYIFCTPIENEATGTTDDTDTTSTCAGGIAGAADGVLSGNNFVVDPSIVGGTSASSPIFAGIVTLMNQYLGTTGLSNINPTLYQIAASPSSGAFHPITSGDNDVYCMAGTPAGNPLDVICPTSGVIGFSASNSDPTTGYNVVSGLGSVDANALATAWKATLVADFALASTALAPTSVPAGQQTTTMLTFSPISGSAPLTVNFAPSNCTGLPAGASCSFSPTSVYFNGTSAPPVTVTISTLATTPTGTQTITITPTNSPKTSTTVSLAVTTTNQSFSIASTGANSFSVSPGATALVQIAVTGTGSPIAFSPAALPITYTCLQSSLPSETTCNFSPSSGNSVSASSVSLSIVTTGPTSQLRPPLKPGRGIFYALLLPGLFGIVFAGSRKQKWGMKASRLRILGFIMVLGLFTFGLGSCGGGSNNSGQSNPGTPAGSYKIIVNATTAGPNALTSTLTVNLTVQ